MKLKRKLTNIQQASLLENCHTLTLVCPKMLIELQLNSMLDGTSFQEDTWMINEWVYWVVILVSCRVQ